MSKTAQDILEDHSPIFNRMFADDNVRRWNTKVIEAMNEYADQRVSEALNKQLSTAIDKVYYAMTEGVLKYGVRVKPEAKDIREILESLKVSTT